MQYRKSASQFIRDEIRNIQVTSIRHYAIQTTHYLNWLKQAVIEIISSWKGNAGIILKK